MLTRGRMVLGGVLSTPPDEPQGIILGPSGGIGEHRIGFVDVGGFGVVAPYIGVIDGYERAVGRFNDFWGSIGLDVQ